MLRTDDIYTVKLLQGQPIKTGLTPLVKHWAFNLSAFLFWSLLLLLLLPTFAYDASLSTKLSFWSRSEKIRRWGGGHVLSFPFTLFRSWP